MRCRVSSSTETLFEGDAIMVVGRSRLGEFAVMDHHAPLLAVLDAAPLRVKTPEREVIFAVRGGLLRVSDNTVTVLAEAIVRADAVDLLRVDADIRKTEDSLPKAEDKEGLLRELRYLRAQRRAKERSG